MDGFGLWLRFHGPLEFARGGLVAFAALVMFRVESLPSATLLWNMMNVSVSPCCSIIYVCIEL